MSITALPVTAWAETPAESAVTGAEIATDHVDENAVDETTDAADQTGQETIENSEEVEQVETAPAESEDTGEDEKQAAGTEQRLNYMYIDQPYLETPNTQKVVVSWGDGSEGIEQMTATVQGPVGEEVWTAAQETDDIYLFEINNRQKNPCVKKFDTRITLSKRYVRNKMLSLDETFKSSIKTAIY